MAERGEAARSMAGQQRLDQIVEPGSQSHIERLWRGLAQDVQAAGALDHAIIGVAAGVAREADRDRGVPDAQIAQRQLWAADSGRCGSITSARKGA